MSPTHVTNTNHQVTNTKYGHRQVQRGRERERERERERC